MLCHLASKSAFGAYYTRGGRFLFCLPAWWSQGRLPSLAPARQYSLVSATLDTTMDYPTLCTGSHAVRVTMKNTAMRPAYEMTKPSFSEGTAKRYSG